MWVLSFGCFAAAFFTLIDMFRLAVKLGPERLEPVTKRQFWTKWIPGRFTPEGQVLRRRITRRFALGLAFLAAGLVLSQLAA